jgi:diacylglycerol kinase (ATP)
LKTRGMEVDLRPTQGPKDAARLAADAAREGFREIIVSGGDGTINEALQGLIGTKAKLGIWPRGTANVLGRELQIPKTLETVVDIVAAGNTRKIHAGCATLESSGEKRYFLLMAGIGIDAAIVERTRAGLKKRVGEAAFWYAGIEYFAKWKPKRFVVEVDGVEHSSTFAAIGKAPRYGGNLAITPRARMDHPGFEICMIHSTNRLRYLRLLPFARFGGMPEGAKEVTFVQTTTARVTGDGVQAQVDGELIGFLPMTFSISEHSIEVIVP